MTKRMPAAAFGPRQAARDRHEDQAGAKAGKAAHDGGDERGQRGDPEQRVGEEIEWHGRHGALPLPS